VAAVNRGTAAAAAAAAAGGSGGGVSGMVSRGAAALFRRSGGGGGGACRGGGGGGRNRSNVGGDVGGGGDAGTATATAADDDATDADAPDTAPAAATAAGDRYEDLGDLGPAPVRPSALIIGTHTRVDVHWQDGGAAQGQTLFNPLLESDWFQTVTLGYQSWFQNVPFKYIACAATRRMRHAARARAHAGALHPPWWGGAG
jgi:hypothetical protein